MRHHVSTAQQKKDSWKWVGVGGLHWFLTNPTNEPSWLTSIKLELIRIDLVIKPNLPNLESFQIGFIRFGPKSDSIFSRKIK